MKFVLGLLFFVAALFGLPAAADPAAKTVAEVQLELLHNLERDGYLSAKLALEAQAKYVDPQQIPSPATAATPTGEGSMWERFGGWIGMMKALAVALFLLCVGILIMTIKLPPTLVQVPLLAAGAFALFRPEYFSGSEAYFVVLFAAILNLLVLSWVLATNLNLAVMLTSWLRALKLPVSSVVCGLLTLYFGVLALHYQSEIFGFLATVTLSGVLCFTIGYMPGIMTLGIKDRALPASIGGHIAVLGGYIALLATGNLPAQAKYFASGLETYCTLALSVGLLIGATPFWTRSISRAGFYALVQIVVALVALWAFQMYGLQAMGTIAVVCAMLVGLEWLWYFGYKVHTAAAIGLTASALYGLAMIAPQYWHLAVLRSA